MRGLFVLGGFLALLGSAEAAPGTLSYSSIPPGTVLSNPSPWADNPIPHSQSYANVGHIALLKAAAMTSASDQLMTMLSPPAKYAITSIYATNCSATPAGAVGGIYTAASKGGTAVVASGQTYTSLASSTAIEALTDNVTTTALTAAQLYFSLTTGASSGTPTCDVYVDGIGLQ